MNSATSVRFTYQDYLLLPEEKRYELIEGDLYLTPAPGTAHQRIVRNLLSILDSFVVERGLGEVLLAPCDVVLSETDVVQPDLLFVAAARKGIIEERRISGAPDLAVEVLSESTAERDRTIKSKLYGRSGVRELWLVSPEAQSIEILVGTGEALVSSAIYSRSQVLISKLLGELRIPLEQVFGR
jgi:Uma2 family endonuclease